MNVFIPVPDLVIDEKPGVEICTCFGKIYCQLTNKTVHSMLLVPTTRPSQSKKDAFAETGSDGPDWGTSAASRKRLRWKLKRSCEEPRLVCESIE